LCPYIACKRKYPSRSYTSIIANSSYNTRTWVYNGDGWERQINAGQVVSVFIVVGVLVTELSAFDNSGNAWYQLDYV
jgi:hypothetical protein